MGCSGTVRATGDGKTKLAQQVCEVAVGGYQTTTESTLQFEPGGVPDQFQTVIADRDAVMAGHLHAFAEQDEAETIDAPSVVIARYSRLGITERYAVVLAPSS